MNDIRYLDPLADLAAVREALRQLLDEGWANPRDLLPAIVVTTA